ERIHLPGFFPVHEFFRVKTFYFTGKFGFEFGGVKLRNRCSATFAIFQSIPIFIERIANGRERACARYYHPFETHAKACCKMIIFLRSLPSKRSPDLR